MTEPQTPAQAAKAYALANGFTIQTDSATKRLHVLVGVNIKTIVGSRSKYADVLKLMQAYRQQELGGHRPVKTPDTPRWVLTIDCPMAQGDSGPESRRYHSHADAVKGLRHAFGSNTDYGHAFRTWPTHAVISYAGQE